MTHRSYLHILCSANTEVCPRQRSRIRLVKRSSVFFPKMSNFDRQDELVGDNYTHLTFKHAVISQSG